MLASSAVGHCVPTSTPSRDRVRRINIRLQGYTRHRVIVNEYISRGQSIYDDELYHNAQNGSSRIYLLTDR
jgi:hypothetical protein